MSSSGYRSKRCVLYSHRPDTGGWHTHAFVRTPQFVVGTEVVKWPALIGQLLFAKNSDSAKQGFIQRGWHYHLIGFIDRPDTIIRKIGGRKIVFILLVFRESIDGRSFCVCKI